MREIIDILIYISRAPYFYLSIGSLTGIAMFVGAILYDGDLTYASKGLISVGIYGFFIFQMNVTRLNNTLTISNIGFDPKAYAATATTIIITIFWLFGVLLGVYISKKVRTAYRKGRRV